MNGLWINVKEKVNECIILKEMEKFSKIIINWRLLYFICIWKEREHNWWGFVKIITDDSALYKICFVQKKFCTKFSMLLYNYLMDELTCMCEISYIILNKIEYL